MKQEVLPFKVKKSSSKITPRAGLVLVDRIAKSLGVIGSLQRLLGHLKMRNRGYRADEKVMDLVRLLVAGGKALSDLKELRADKALMGSLNREAIMSCSTASEFLSQFDENDIQNLSQIVGDAASGTVLLSRRDTATMDADATFIQADKKNAQMSYHGETGYYPMLGFIAETQGCLLGEFRDGNASPASGALGFLKEMVNRLPVNIVRKRVRSDSAWFNHEVTDWCEEEGIEFAITGEMNIHMREVIRAIAEDKWEVFGEVHDEKVAESVYSFEHGSRACRVIVLREPMRQLPLFGDEYKYRAIITNMNWEKHRLVKWHRERATSENWIKELKGGFGLEDLPSNKFQSNSAYMQIVMLAYNLINALKVLSLPGEYSSCTIKTLRFRLINIAGLWVKHAREFFLKIAASTRIVKLVGMILKEPFKLCRT